MTTSQTKNTYIALIQKSDLSASGTIACPNRMLNMPQWASHPFVYLQFDDTGLTTCPYCSTVYQLKVDE